MRLHHRNYDYRPPYERKTGSRGGKGLYSRFVRAYLLPHKWRLLFCLSLVCTNACSVYLLPLFTRYVVDDILMVGEAAAAAPTKAGPQRIWAADRGGVAGGGRQSSTGHDGAGLFAGRRAPGAGRRLLLVGIFYAFTVIVINLMGRAASRRQIVVGQQVGAALRDDLHRKLLDLSLAYHRSHTPGRLLARVMSDVDVVQARLMTSVISLASSSSSILLGVGILLVADWRVALIAVTITPLYALVYRKARAPVKEISRELRHTNSCLYGLSSQKLEGIKAIQAYGREGRERLSFHRLTACLLRDGIAQQRLSALVSQVCVVISALGTLSIFLYGTNQVLAGQMTLGKMLYVYGATASLFAPVLMLTQVGVIFNHLLVILQRLVEILDERLEIEEDPDAAPFPVPMKQGIRVRGVSFGHDPDSPPLLSNIALDIPAGRWVCLMGPSGCGKTTLLYLLARLLAPDAGRIAVDGVPLAKLGIDALRERVALVPQEAQIFKGTIRENITYGQPDAEPAQIMAAAKAAQIHDLIMEMKVQYETVVGEKGMSLSGGQRQRLSLARALLTDPDVLLLDDCTSALDAETEHRIQETLSEILVGKTAVIVSQRVSMAMRCHRIYVVDEGVVVESGAHAELLARGGFYARLHRQQTE